MGKDQVRVLKIDDVGPYYAIEDLPKLPGRIPRLLNRFGVLGRHGVADEASVRNIDGGKARGHN